MKDDLEIVRELIFGANIEYIDFKEYFSEEVDRSIQIIETLKEALVSKNSRALNQGLYSISLNGYIDKRYTIVLIEILENHEEWNHTHEIVCDYLEKISDPKSIDSLVESCLKYQFSDVYNVPLKAIWAITTIGSSKSIKALRKLKLIGNKRTSIIAKKYLGLLLKNKCEEE